MSDRLDTARMFVWVGAIACGAWHCWRGDWLKAAAFWALGACVRP